MKLRPNWGTLYLSRRKDNALPAKEFREVKPEPPRDVEAELDRLAEKRREREEWLRSVVDGEGE